MAEKETNKPAADITSEMNEDAQAIVARAKSFWTKYNKIITYAGIAIILVAGCWWGYMKFFKEPNEDKAMELIFPAEKLFDQMANTSFNKDSVNIVLNGGVMDGQTVTGLLKIISNYGSTAQGNRAEYMAGACYLQIGEFDKAIKHIKEFNGHGTQLESKAYMMLGHAYAEKDNSTEALGYYKKAAEVNTKDESISAFALLTAAQYAKEKGNTKEALVLFKKLVENYPASQLVPDAEKAMASMNVFE